MSELKILAGVVYPFEMTLPLSLNMASYVFFFKYVDSVTTYICSFLYFRWEIKFVCNKFLHENFEKD